MSYLDELNLPQREAVEYIDGPALVIAGAGSGKTRVLTYKIMHLIENGFQPWNILAITFTNKAAREMKERIAQKIGEQKAAQLWMGTFHSIFLRILKVEVEHTDYQKNFTIYDQADARNVVKGIIKEMNLPDKTYPVNDIASRISTAKNRLITPQMYASSDLYADDCNVQYGKPNRERTNQIYMEYSRRCHQANAMDFDDLLLQTLFLFQNHPELIDKYSDKFKYILVDEYQDTNSVQYNIVRALGSRHHKVFVVGDDAQSIYSFRGAQIENILNFRKDYKEAKIFKLEQNYRSTQTIVNAANAVIAKNSKQLKKDSFSENEFGNKIRVLQFDYDTDEGYKIAADIKKQVEFNGLKYSDFALLYRTNAQARILEEAFHKHTIPYRIYGGMSFYQRKEVKDLLAYLRLLVNGNDDEAFKRVVNYPKRGIGDTTMDKISQLAARNNLSIWNTVAQIQRLDSSISVRTVNALAGFMKMIYQCMVFSQTADAFQTVMQCASASGMLKDLYDDKSVEGISRYENVQELLNGVKTWVEYRQKLIAKEYTRQQNEGKREDDVDPKEQYPIDLPAYLEEVSLMTGDESEDEDTNKVSLLTIHSAKGLEFRNVYLTGLEEGLFPSTRNESLNAIEEERRLFYVAVTRAEKCLTITFAKFRRKYGEYLSTTPSRFIREIDPRYIDFGVGGESLFEASVDVPFVGRTRKTFYQNDQAAKGVTEKSFADAPPAGFKKIPRSFATFKKADTSDFAAGVLVEHPKFGRGKIVSVENSGADTQYVIDFMSAGRKKLLAKFANLKKSD